MIVDVPYLRAVRGIPPGKRTDHVACVMDTLPVEILEVDVERAPVVYEIEMPEHRKVRLAGQADRVLPSVSRAYALVDGDWYYRSSEPEHGSDLTGIDRHLVNFASSTLSRFRDLPYPANRSDIESAPESLGLAPPSRRGLGLGGWGFENPDEIKKRTTRYRDMREFQAAAANMRGVVETEETARGIHAIRVGAAATVLVDGVPFRRCEEPYLHRSVDRYNDPRIHVAHGPVERVHQRWGLEEIDRLRDFLGGDLVEGLLPRVVVHRSIASRMDGIESGFREYAENVLRRCAGHLAKVDVDYFLAFRDLRDLMGGQSSRAAIEEALLDMVLQARHVEGCIDPRYVVDGCRGLASEEFVDRLARAFEGTPAAPAIADEDISALRMP